MKSVINIMLRPIYPRRRTLVPNEQEDSSTPEPVSTFRSGEHLLLLPGVKTRIVQPVANQHVTKQEACIGTLWFIIAGICEQWTQTQATFYTLATQLTKIPSNTTECKAGVWVPSVTMIFLFVTTPRPTLVSIYTTIITKMTIYWTSIRTGTWQYTFTPTYVFMSRVFRFC